MKKAWHIWLMFFLFLGVVISVMAWITDQVLNLERANVEAQHRAQVEEVVRVALWRMDSAVSLLIIEESSRPYYEYSAFNPLNVAVATVGQTQQGEELVASPLLTATPPNVNVYFNGTIDGNLPTGWLSSPQVPKTPLANWSADNFGNHELMISNTLNLKQFSHNVSQGALQEAFPRQAQDWGGQQLAQAEQVSAPQQLMMQQADVQQRYEVQQQAKGDIEYSSRRRQVAKKGEKIRSAKSQYYEFKGKAANALPNIMQPQDQVPQRAEPLAQPVPQIDEDVMQISWVNDLLVLGRNVSIDGASNIQGAWLDWDGMKAELLAEVEDLLPDADLVRANPDMGQDFTRMLAAFPAKLIPGAPAMIPAVMHAPLRVPLMIAWCCLTIAFCAVALLLSGAINLSERRGAFVSAVAHELRTPLTTFRMYTEMLSEGLIKDPPKIQQYLDTLHRESNRLGHLVENVLAYARLERGTGSRVMETMGAGDILERAGERLALRASQADMQLVVDAGEEARALMLKTNLMSVEQILLNLVDNACKYAAEADDKTVHLAVEGQDGHVVFRVCDHGPGLKKNEIRAVFKPFRKSAVKAAQSAPGVGLGLALSRRLAQQLGGDIRYEEHDAYGACFVLVVPRMR